MTTQTLGADLGVRAPHVATLCDEAGAVIWSEQQFRTSCEELAKLLARVGDSDGLVVVMEPTRNAWVPVAANFVAQGARVVLVPPERAADLRRYYAKHTKNDRLDSTVPARLPRLHPEGLNPIDGLGPAEPMRRAVRRRVKLVKARYRSRQRLDSLLDLLGPGYADVLGARYGVSVANGQDASVSADAGARPNGCDTARRRADPAHLVECSFLYRIW